MGADAEVERHDGTPPGEDEIAARMRAEGLSPHGWGNGPGDTYAVLMPAIGIAGAVAPAVRAQALGAHPCCDLVFAWRRAVMPLDRSVRAHRRTSSQPRV